MSQTLLKEFLKAGVHFGHKTYQRHPKMQSYIFAKRDKVHIIDLNKTVHAVKEAYNELHAAGKSGQDVVFVGTKKTARRVLEQMHETYGIYTVSNRWLGGFMTNFDVVSESMRKMERVEEEINSEDSELKKKERVRKGKELVRLKRFFSGVRGLTRIPSLIVVVDPKAEVNAVHEARLLGVRSIGIVDTDTDPDIVDCCIPSNDEGVRSLSFVLGILVRAYVAGREEYDKQIEEAKKEAEVGIDTAMSEEVSKESQMQANAIAESTQSSEAVAATLGEQKADDLKLESSEPAKSK